jgi:hypothetical protein
VATAGEIEEATAGVIVAAKALGATAGMGAAADIIEDEVISKKN